MSSLIPSLKTATLSLALACTGAVTAAQADTALVAGGCFWCVEADFEKVKGVQEVVSGFAGGTVDNPTYKQVVRGGTGHLEVAQIEYDPNQISYERIIELFLRSIDPLDAGGQFCDRGESYTTAIFALDDSQAQIARQEVAEAEAELGRKIVTPVRGPAEFFPAEDYHQDYYKGNDIVLTRRGPKTMSEAYEFYRDACRRDERVREIWGDDAPFVG
ncbi:peptide-methionine (S)-S-oxide reductase MsrA [Maribius pontilimi]|uniref:Peptide methionine sulfoxide reductase MsrA n=1 Tax=Palleronia pontilimi TaxID=1964209 RepID=A0A934I6W3_9RHOB|nr:peptide-methionine (S)-S-oxide reductase MsrA [Palleronia pontilimi]MBJ3761559.1 peptide-methionine (S)-S-oxide reductase MsrA [Palleronia pontilimi]